MALQLSQDAIETFVSNFLNLSNKVVLLLDETFDFNDVEGSVLKSFPTSLPSVVKSKVVISHFVMPQLTQHGCSVEAAGPIKMNNIKSGKISGFIVFDGDTDASVLSTTGLMSSKILMCSNLVSKVGTPAIITLQDVDVTVGSSNMFYSFNMSIMGL